MLAAVVLAGEKRIEGLVKGNVVGPITLMTTSPTAIFIWKSSAVLDIVMALSAGLDRLGLVNGLDYVGKGGAAMKSYLYSYISLVSRYDFGIGRYHYPIVTMGDARGGGGELYGIQHSMVLSLVPSLAVPSAVAPGWVRT